MKSLTLHPHSILLLIGPSGCGKTYFTENHLIPALTGFNVQHVSSDQIRRELLGKDHHKYDREMLHISQQAFDVLLNRVRNLSTYPVNAEFIIVDTKGLHKEFREQIITIARQNHYRMDALVFAYKDREDFFEYLPQDTSGWMRKMISTDIQKLNRETLKDLRPVDYDHVHRFKDNQFKDVKIELESTELYQKCQLALGPKYRLVGDVHGCYKALKAVYKEAKAQGEKLVLVGDFIDKGPQTKDVVEFIFEHLDDFILVKGNHENFVYKYLEGQIEKGKIDAETMAYFDSIALFEKDAKLKAKFYKLFERSTEFVKHRDFIATHAPCQTKFLGKVDPVSLKCQRNFRFPRRKEYESDEAYIQSLETSLAYLKEEAQPNHPIHVFAHMALWNRNLAKNKICIDNGCVHGQGLTSVVFDPQFPKPRFHQTPSLLEENEIMQALVPKLYTEQAEANVEKLDLDDRDYARIHRLAEKKVNFISGTMCPADKLGDELESLEQGLNYYQQKGVETVILQPKYMGSRCNIYLFKKPEDCYATSRNGFVISPNFLDLTPLYKKLIKQFSSYFKEKKVKMLLVDGELMPWSALGKELIEDQFKTTALALKKETEFLKKEGFESALSDLQKKYDEINYPQTLKELGKSKFIEEHDHSLYRTMEAYAEFSRSSWKSLQSEQEKIKRYQDQLAFYGHEDEPVSFKPFMLLKAVFNNGKEECFVSQQHKNTEIYPEISDDAYLILSLKDKKALSKAQKFFEELTVKNRMEGVVIKPEIVYQEGIAPYMKVRNKDYLTIIYGYDYLSERKYQKLLSKKSILRKLRASREEFKIGKKMLEIPYEDIAADNKAYFSLCAQMIAEEKVERELDPRL